MILLRSFLSGHIRIKRTLEYYDAGIGPRVPFGGGFGPTVSANFAVALGDFTTLSSTSTMPTGGLITRAGNAMLYDSTGKLTWAPNNLLTYSEQFNQYSGSTSGAWYPSTAPSTFVTANAATAPDGTLTADQLAFPASSDFLIQDITSSVASKTFIFSIYIRAASATTCRIRITQSGGGNNVTTASVTPSWQRFSVVYTTDASATFVRATIQPDTSNSPTILVWGSQLEAVTYQTTPSTYVATTTSAYYGPRFDYDPVTLQPKGLLVEGTRTNVQPYSNGFNSWTAGAPQKASFNLVSTTQPDGTATGYALIEDNTAGVHQGLYGSYNRGSSSSLTYTATVYAKSSTRRLVFQVLDGPQTSGAYATYDLAGGQVGISAAVFGTYTNPISTIQNVGGGWYRCRLTFTSNTNASFFTYLFLDNATGTAAASTSYTGNGTSGVNVFGVQIEEGAFPTSYIPVPAASTAPTNTRSPDAFTLTGYANRLVEAYYIDEQTGGSYSGNSALSTGTVTISPPTFGWVTALRAYQNAYAGSISSPSWLSFSRAGNAMYYDSTGTLTWAPSNMLLNSATLSTQTVTVTSGATNLLSFSGTGSITYSGAASGTLTGTGANNRVSVVLTMSTTSLTLTVSGTVTNAQLEPVTYQTAPSAYIPTTSAAVYQPRYDYDPSVTPATPRGMLIEEQRVNVCTYSQAINASANWNANTTVTSTQTGTPISPDGVSLLTKLIEGNSTQNHRISSPFLGQSNAVAYTWSVYAKAGERSVLQLSFGGNISGTAYANFDLANGVIGSYSGNLPIITAVGNGIYRCQVYVTAGSGTSEVAYFSIQTSTTAARSASYAGNGSSGLYVWGAQLEAGSFATSYIPTTTASVTRVADVVKLSGSALTTANAGTASAIAQTTKVYDSVAFQGILASTQSRRILYLGASNTLAKTFEGTTALSVTIGGSGTWTGGPVRAAVGWSASADSSGNKRSLVANNGTVLADSLSLGSSSGDVYVGRDDPTQDIFSGWVASLALYNQRLPDTILKQKSTVGAPY